MVFYFLIYKDAAAETARQIDSFRVGSKTLGKIDGVDTFADLMYRPAMPVKEVRFKGWAMSKVPDMSDLEDLDDDGRLAVKDETLAETLSRMKAGESLQEAYARGAKTRKKSLQSRLKDMGSGHGRKPRAGSTHGRVEGTGSNHGRVRISPSSHSRVEPPSTAVIGPTKPRGCLVVRTLEQSLNSCKMEPRSSPPERSSSHSRNVASVSVASGDGILSFGTIEIRQYTRVLGDNPACPAGPPVSLGWKYSPKSIVVSVDEYEIGREPRRKDSRLRLSVKRRETMLRALGYSTRDLIEADRVRRKDQILRERTVCRMRYRHFEETVETAKRITHLNRKKKAKS